MEIESVSGSHEAVISDGTNSVRLHAPFRPYGDEPPPALGFSVDIESNGLSAAASVQTLTGSEMARFFDEVAASWKGWSGAKTYVSSEGDFEIVATSARANVGLRFLVLPNPVNHREWTASVTVRVEAGEATRDLARRVAEFTASTR